MTIKDLKEILDKYPEDTVLLYRHNQYGKVEIDEIDFSEEKLLSGEVLKTLTFEASFEE